MHFWEPPRPKKVVHVWTALAKEVGARGAAERGKPRPRQGSFSAESLPANIGLATAEKRASKSLAKKKNMSQMVEEAVRRRRLKKHRLRRPRRLQRRRAPRLPRTHARGSRTRSKPAELWQTVSNIFGCNFERRKTSRPEHRAKGVSCVASSRRELFQTSIGLQTSASIQPRASLLKLEGGLEREGPERPSFSSPLL